jgi:hypothetical protein
MQKAVFEAAQEGQEHEGQGQEHEGQGEEALGEDHYEEGECSHYEELSEEGEHYDSVY